MIDVRLTAFARLIEPKGCLDKSEIQEPFYLLNIMSRLDAVCVEHSGITHFDRVGDNWVFGPRSGGKQPVLLKSIIARYTIKKDIYQFQNFIFLSSMLAKEIASREWKGLVMEEREEI